MWRTLTASEWNYLMTQRINATEKRGLATVNNVNGLIILPDNWILPSNLTFTSGTNNSYTTNTYSKEEWNDMENNGAVFLPAAGSRWSTRYSEDNIIISYNNNFYGSQEQFAEEGGVPSGHYWSSSYAPRQNSYYNAKSLVFNPEIIRIGSDYNATETYYGCSVRLVRDVEQ